MANAPTWQQALVEGTGGDTGELLWTGRVTFTHNENSIEYVDVPDLGLNGDDACLLSVRNSSSVIDLTCFVGHMVMAQPAAYAGESLMLNATDLAALRWTLASSGSNTVFQNTGHGLSVGDALECVTAGGTNCTAGVIYYVHGADHETNVPADTLYLSLTRADDGTLIDATNATAGTFKLASEFHSFTSFTVPKFTAEVIATPAVTAGMESKLISAWPFAGGGGRLQFGFVDADMGVLTVYAEIRRA